MSGLSWSCYLCTFESLNIDHLQLHIDEEHLNLFTDNQSIADSQSTADTKIEESFSKQVKIKTEQKFSKSKSIHKAETEKFPNYVPKQKESILSRRKSLR